MTTPTKREILNFPANLTQAAHLAIVQIAVRDARTETPPQRGWICHGSCHYNTPGSTAAPTSPCRCGHDACRPVPNHTQDVPLTSGNYYSSAGYVVNPFASTANISVPAACFDVQVTTRDDARHYGWVCFFCKVYTAWGVHGDGNAAHFLCTACGVVKEKEVVFVKRSLVGYSESFNGEDGVEDGDGWMQVKGRRRANGCRRL